MPHLTHFAVWAEYLKSKSFLVLFFKKEHSCFASKTENTSFLRKKQQKTFVYSGCEMIDGEP